MTPDAWSVAINVRLASRFGELVANDLSDIVAGPPGREQVERLLEACQDQSLLQSADEARPMLLQGLRAFGMTSSEPILAIAEHDTRYVFISDRRVVIAWTGPDDYEQNNWSFRQLFVDPSRALVLAWAPEASDDSYSWYRSLLHIYGAGPALEAVIPSIAAHIGRPIVREPVELYDQINVDLRIYNPDTGRHLSLFPTSYNLESPRSDQPKTQDLLRLIDPESDDAWSLGVRLVISLFAIAQHLAKSEHPKGDPGAGTSGTAFIPRLIRGHQDAEIAARDWLRSAGFPDARTTPQGADGGVDVRGADLVAQVKAEMLPTGRPIVQQIFGIAAAENKAAYCFSLAGFTPDAIVWAAKAGVQLFRFDLQGVPQRV